MAYLPGWNATKRFKLIIDNTKIDENLTDFPVSITLSSGTGQTGFDATAVFDELSTADRKKIAVTTSNGTTQCPVEIEYWDSTEEQAYLWTKVPTVASGTDTDLYLYYDNTATTNSGYVGDTGEAVAQQVWGSLYKGVWHLNESTGVPIVDSTSNANTSSIVGTDPPSTSGIVGGAFEFDGTPDYFEIDADASVDLSSWDYFTVSAWFKPSTFAGDNYPILFAYGAFDLSLGLNKLSGGADGQLEVWMNDFDYVGGGGVVSNLNEWNHAVVVRDSWNNTITYLNGVQVDFASSVNITGGAVDCFIGGSNSGYQDSFTGLIDEVRVSAGATADGARSSAWIRASYNSTRNSLITFAISPPPTMQNRMKITIQPDNVDNILTDFPLMIYLSSESGRTGYDATAIFDELSTVNRKKIAITTASGEPQWPVEIEYWDSTERIAYLWTKVPTITSGVDTDFYLYYDDSSPYWSTVSGNLDYVGDTGEAPAQQVWDDNFVGVWHMSQDPSGGVDAVLDSTSKINHGTSSGTMTSDDLVNSKVGKGINFDGIDDSIDCGSSAYLDDIGTITIESIFRAANWGEGSAGRIASKSTSGNLNGWNLFVQSNSDYNFGYSQDWSNVAQWETPISSIVLGYWYHGVVQYDRSYSTSDKPIMYLNGEIQTVTTSTAPTGSIESDAAQDMVVAARASTDRQFEGIIDEVRVSDIHRSAAWIKATYLSAWDNFVTFYSPELPLTMQYRMKLTIPPDNVGSNLIDFPVMINLSSSSGKTGYDTTAIFDELSTADRRKIAVTTSDGTTQCPVEIEYWDSIEREAVLWTKAPTVYYYNNTDFYLYYDSTVSGNLDYVGDTGERPAKQVWDDNFIGIWHMAQDPSGGTDAILDSTLNIHHGTASGTMLTEDLVDGKIGEGIAFDGIDDKITTTAAGVLAANPRTVEVIFKTTTSGGPSAGGLVFWGKDPNGEKWNFRIDDSNGALRTECQGGNCIATTSVEDNNWHYGVSLFNGTDIEDVVHYLNGMVETKSSSSSYTVNTVDAYRIIMGAQHSSWYYLPATIDEVRVSNVARSAAWIRATYHSNWDDLIIYEMATAPEVTLDMPVGNLSVNDYFIFRALNTDIYRTKLTIDGTKIDGVLTDFPINVTLSSGTGQTNFNTEQVFETLESYKFSSYDNRKRIYVVDNLDNKLYTEIERWDQNNKQANLWVKVSTVYSGVDTVLHLCYNPAFEDQIAYTGDTGSTAAQNAWDEYFTTVWHMSQDPSGGTDCIIDSTGNETHGTPDGDMTSDDLVDGKIWKAIDFDGLDDVINGGTTAANDMTGALTLEAIFKTYTLKTQMIIAKDDDDTPNRKYELHINSDQSVEANIFETTASSVNTNTNDGVGGSFIDDSYHHAAVTIDTTGSYIQPVTGLYIANDYPPTSGTLNNEPVLVDGQGWYSSGYVGASFGSAGFDLGSAKTVVRIEWIGRAGTTYVPSYDDYPHRYFYTGTSPYDPYEEPSDWMNVYKSDDNYTWTLVELFDDMLVESWELDGSKTWIYWTTIFSVPQTARYFKMNNKSSFAQTDYLRCAQSPTSTNNSAVYLTEIRPHSDAGLSRLYIDGVLNVSSTDTGNENVLNSIQSQPTLPVLMGDRYNESSDYNFDGILDEVRISSARRSAEWVKATYYSNWDDLITYEDAETVRPPGEVQVYDTSGILLGTVYHGTAVTSVWASNDYLYMGTTDFGVLWSPMSSISGSVYYDLSVYKTYPDIYNKSVNYIHGDGNYFCVATISGVNIFDLTTNSGIYSNASILANQCHQLSDRTSYYIYDNKLETVYNDDSTYIYQSGDGIIPTVSGVTDLCAVGGDKNLILLATTDGAVVIEEDKGNESNSRVKYYYIEE